MVKLLLNYDTDHCTILVMCRVGSGSDTQGQVGLWEAWVKRNIKPSLHRGLGLGPGWAGLKPGLVG